MIDIKIRIDSREKKRGHKALEFYTLKGYDARIKTLTYGDYVFDDRVVFELKIMDDFMNSISNKSLFNETYNQALKYQYHYLIVIGDLKTYYNSLFEIGLSPNYGDILKRFNGAIRRVRTYSNVIMCKNETLAFNEMLEQSKKCVDGNSKYYSNIVRETNDAQDIVDFVLGRTNGIGSKRIKLIRDTLDIKTIYDLLDCSVDDFNSVKGIGEKTAKNLYNFIHSC